MLSQILNESINDKGKFKAIFLAGAPGSGKSYTSKKIIDGGVQPRIVNPDKFYEYFLFNDGGLDIDIMDTTTRLVKKQLFFYVDGMLPLLVDTTSSTIISTIRRKAMLESIGYDTGLCWVDTDLEIALQRNRERNRVVDEDFLRHAHESIQKNVHYLKSDLDIWYSMKQKKVFAATVRKD